MWVEYLPEILWSYHTTPHSTTQETPFRMVYGADAMIPVEINTSTWRREHFDENANIDNLNISADQLDEVRESARIREAAAKQRLAKRYNLKVRQRGFQEGDLVLKKVTDPKNKGKLAPNWEGPYRVLRNLNNGAYKLETLEGIEIPRTWSISNLRLYFS